MPPSVLPRGLRWWQEHPLEALVIQVRLWLENLMRSGRRGGAEWGRLVPGEGPSGARRDPSSSLGWPVKMRFPAQTAVPFWDWGL